MWRHRTRTARGVALLAAGMLTLTGCIHRFEPVETDASTGHRWTQDLYVGDVVRVGLADGRWLEGEVRWFNASNLKVDDEIVSLAEVRSLEKRRINALGASCLGLTVVVVVVGILYIYAVGKALGHAD